jgi:hypothetical protein
VAARGGAIRIWTAELVKRLEPIIAEQSGQLYALWLLVALTGLRRSEALGLRWMDVDLPRGRVSVRQVIVKVGSRAVVKDAPKSEHGYRAVDIGPKLVAVLRAREAEQLDERMAAGREWEDNDLVFAHPTVDPRAVPPGRWWYPGHAIHRIAELIADSGLQRIRPLQDLRRTHASLLLAAGESPKVVQEWLGHHTHRRSPRAPTSTCCRAWARPQSAGSRRSSRTRRGGGSAVTPDARHSVAHERRNPAEAGFPGADDGIRTRDLHLGKVESGFRGHPPPSRLFDGKGL